MTEFITNHQLALNVLDRVVIKLESQNLYDDNCFKVFLDQESGGIIERIDVSPDDFDKYIWVPHRPVEKKRKKRKRILVVPPRLGQYLIVL